MQVQILFSQRWFSRLILIALAVGLLFPSIHSNLKFLNLICLGLLFFFPTLKIDFNEILPGMRAKAGLIGLSLVMLFIPLPVIVYFLGKWANLDPIILTGLVLASASPCMLSVPYLSELIGGETRIAWSLTVISTLLSPLVYTLLAYFLSPDPYKIDINAISRTILLQLFIPISAAFLIRKFFSPIRTKISAFENPVSLAAIVLINLLFVNYNRDIIINLPLFVFFIIFLIGILQSVGVFFLTRWLTKEHRSNGESISLAVSYSMRNSALIGSVALLYDVRLALAASIFAFSNALMFILIDKIKHDQMTGRNTL